MEAVYEYNLFKLHLGVLLQDKERRTSPILNSVYPATRNLAEPEPSYEYVLWRKIFFTLG